MLQRTVGTVRWQRSDDVSNTAMQFTSGQKVCNFEFCVYFIEVKTVQLVSNACHHFT